MDKETAMLVPIVAIFFSFCMMQAMEGESNNASFRQTITIKTMKSSLEIGYGNNTTILNIKQYLEQEKGIPIARQKLIAFVPSTNWFFGLFSHSMATRSDELADNKTINEILENYGAGTTFELYLKLHKKSV